MCDGDVRAGNGHCEEMRGVPGIGKIGESPSGGMSGNLITLATWDGSRCPFVAGSSTCVNARRVFGVAGDDEGHASKSTGTG
jgi:hypothetical protein